MAIINGTYLIKTIEQFNGLRIQQCILNISKIQISLKKKKKCKCQKNNFLYFGESINKNVVLKFQWHYTIRVHDGSLQK